MNTLITLANSLFGEDVVRILKEEATTLRNSLANGRDFATSAFELNEDGTEYSLVAPLPSVALPSEVSVTLDDNDSTLSVEYNHKEKGLISYSKLDVSIPEDMDVDFMNAQIEDDKVTITAPVIVVEEVDEEVDDEVVEEPKGPVTLKINRK